MTSTRRLTDARALADRAQRHTDTTGPDGLLASAVFSIAAYLEERDTATPAPVAVDDADSDIKGDLEEELEMAINERDQARRDAAALLRDIDDARGEIDMLRTEVTRLRRDAAPKPDAEQDDTPDPWAPGQEFTLEGGEPVGLIVKRRAALYKHVGGGEWRWWSPIEFRWTGYVTASSLGKVTVATPGQLAAAGIEA